MSNLLEITDVKKHYPLRGRFLGGGPVEILRAVDGVSFHIERGETLALVGESGCGKSTLARLILRLIDMTSGSVNFDGEEISETSGRSLRALRRRMQIVFQDPFASLNPKFNVRQIIQEPLVVHGIGNRSSRQERVNELLKLVGLDATYAERMPNEFSGGQRQRIGIARALALQPELVVCDEPVSALDVSIQAQVINLLKDLQQRFGLAYLFIAHDLAIVKHMADRVAVMYLGKIVETGTRDDLFKRPAHPYTRNLLASIPGTGASELREKPKTLDEPPSPLAVPSGCSFRTRCPFAIDICKEQEPPLETVAGKHATACHRWRELPDPNFETFLEGKVTAVTRRMELYERNRLRMKVGAA